ncbi:MAG: M23 family metallopeptidase [Nitrospirota bacterium]
MRTKIYISSHLIPMLLLFSLSANANAFKAEVQPSEVSQGGAFAIIISGEEIPKMPAAALNKKSFYFSPCGDGCFIAVGAVDMDTEPGEYSILVETSGGDTNLKLVVKHTAFPAAEMTLPDDKVFLSPEDLERAVKEEEKLKLIWQSVNARLWDGDFIMPLQNNISTAFGTKRIINNKKTSIHRGMDIRGKQGDGVKASNRGRVVLAEELFFGGNTIVLDHGQGIFTIYMHLSAFNVGPDDLVSKGDIIGFVGSSGRSIGPHLHFGVKVLDINTDPLSVMRLKLS